MISEYRREFMAKGNDIAGLRIIYKGDFDSLRNYGRELSGWGNRTGKRMWCIWQPSIQVMAASQ